jgi:hypothetical protein
MNYIGLRDFVFRSKFKILIDLLLESSELSGPRGDLIIQLDTVTPTHPEGTLSQEELSGNLCFSVIDIWKVQSVSRIFPIINHSLSL